MVLIAWEREDGVARKKRRVRVRSLLVSGTPVERI